METSNRFAESLLNLKQSENYRSLKNVEADNLIDLSSNDYLGLLNDTQFKQGFYNRMDSTNCWFGSGSSRLLSGNSKEYTELEILIAHQYNRPACLIYNSGYHANTGILPALAGKKDLIIADKLVHASLIDGMQLSSASVARYRHLDYDHLEKILSKSRQDYEYVFIVSESIFSMDGDIADLEKLVELKQRYNCLLYIDEAHALGVRGNTGLGCVEEAGLMEEIDFIIGTFGKAIASVGAFIVCDNIFREYLINYSRTLIYTTALPPLNLVWTKYVMEKLPDLQYKREKLWQLSKQFAELLNSDAQSHIVPQIIGSNNDAIAASNALKQKGFNVMPIRYPTVPVNTARLRFSLNSNLNMNELVEIKDIIGV